MTDIVGVRFKPVGKIYYFAPKDLPIKKDDHVIVETARGVEFGTVVIGKRPMEDSLISQPLKDVIRLATKADYKVQDDNRIKEKEAFDICGEKIKKHNLDMKLVDVEYTFDRNKILFYFTADGRIDFRELVKDLATIFRTRIELRQIGVRDESKTMGSIGICGRNLCCSDFLGDFEPVSIKMAKEQGLSLNPTKISGACGRLMCCLKYEQDTYEELMKTTPRQGSFVKTPKGNGTVEYVSLLKGILKVRVEGAEKTLHEFKPDEVKVLRRPTRDTNEQKNNNEILKKLED